jgi:hypothetical protein
LFHGEDAFEVGLGGFQFGLLFFPGGTVFSERILDLRNRRVVVQYFPQRFLFFTGLRPKTAPSAGSSRSAGTAGTSAWTAHSHAAAIVGFPARVHHFLNQRLNCRPFIVIGDVQIFSDLVHHVLPELGGIEVASWTAVARASRSRTAAIVILRDQTSAAQPEGGSHPHNA